MDLLSVGKKVKKEESIEQLFANLSPEQQNEIAHSLVTKMAVEKKSLKEVLGLDSSLLDQVYDFGNEHYVAGNYKEAFNLFNMLVMADPTNFNYLFALASTCHQMNYYYDAIVVFTSLLYFEGEHPEVAYYLGDSYYHVQSFKEAEEAFLLAVEWAGEKAEHRIMKEQALLLISSLKSKK